MSTPSVHDCLGALARVLATVDDVDVISCAVGTDYCLSLRRCAMIHIAGAAPSDAVPDSAVLAAARLGLAHGPLVFCNALQDVDGVPVVWTWSEPPTVQLCDRIEAAGVCMPSAVLAMRERIA